MPLPKPSGLSVQNEQRLVNIEGQAKRCSDMIKRIEDMISRLNNARTTGIWKYDRDKSIKIKKLKKFTSGVLDTVQRGEDLEVIKFEGEWWQVRNSTGVEGWIHNGEVSPVLPVELSSEAGKNSPPEPKTREEAIERSDDAGSITGGRG
jgi:hypothetical protein